MAIKPPVPPLSLEPLLAASPHPQRMTWEEFLNVNVEGFYAEWVDGEIMMLNTPGDAHQILVSFLDITMNLYALKFGAGTVRIAPFLLRLERSARHLDVMFIATANLPRIQPKYVEGAPDIVVEILSDSTCDTDEQAKYREYEAAGVREYWQLDPERQQTAFFRLGADGKFFPVTLTQGVFHSEALPGFFLKEDWLWNNPLGRLPGILRELGAV
jgi:Uma2 family endonuclease